jgi:hypothetical protein
MCWEGVHIMADGGPELPLYNVQGAFTDVVNKNFRGPDWQTEAVINRNYRRRKVLPGMSIVQQT